MPGWYLARSAEDWAALLREKDPLWRRLAAHGLGEIGPEAPEVAPALKTALKDEESFVRVWAAAALARVAPKDADAVKALVVGTREELAFVRSLAAWHLGRLGPVAPGIKDVIPDLERLLKDPDPNVREEASLAIKRLKPRRPPTH